MVCINDVHMTNDKFLACRKQLLEAFDEILPDKSRYEK